MEKLIRYNWPGNIREVENCLERAVIVGRGELIAPADLPPAAFTVWSAFAADTAYFGNSPSKEIRHGYVKSSR